MDEVLSSEDKEVSPEEEVKEVDSLTYLFAINWKFCIFGRAVVDATEDHKVIKNKDVNFIV